MQNFIGPRIHDNEVWGQSVEHFKIPNIQPHMLPNLKFHMPFYFIGMLIISLLNLFQKIFNSSVFFFPSLDHIW